MMSGHSLRSNALGVAGIPMPITDESLPDQTSPDVEELLRQIHLGDIDQFAELISRYQKHVIRIVCRRVPADRVDEIAHDVFVRAYVGLAQFSRSVAFEHWLAGIAVRTCYDFWRTRKSEALPVSALTAEHQRWMDRVLTAQSDDQFCEQARRREATEVLEWALEQLSPENRAVLTLVHLDGHSVREAAQLLGWSMINVKVRAHRARRALRTILISHHGGKEHDSTR
jgi:RNA polymerase sigma-70 factor (ECF subfamily)